MSLHQQTGPRQPYESCIRRQDAAKQDCILTTFKLQSRLPYGSAVVGTFWLVSYRPCRAEPDCTLVTEALFWRKIAASDFAETCISLLEFFT